MSGNFQAQTCIIIMFSHLRSFHISFCISKSDSSSRRVNSFLISSVFSVTMPTISSFSFAFTNASSWTCLNWGLHAYRKSIKKMLKLLLILTLSLLWFYESQERGKNKISCYFQWNYACTWMCVMSGEGGHFKGINTHFRCCFKLPRDDNFQYFMLL